MIFRFERFQADDGSFRLIADGVPIPLEPKAFRLLLYLIENRGRLVRKQELLNAVWADATVTESALTRAVGLLRKTLDDNSRAPRFIETVPTAGYRFIAHIETDGTAPAETTPSPPPHLQPHTLRPTPLSESGHTSAALPSSPLASSPASPPLPPSGFSPPVDTPPPFTPSPSFLSTTSLATLRRSTSPTA